MGLIKQAGIQIRNVGALAAALTANANARLYTKPEDKIPGILPTNWPSALQPIPPIGGPDANPLQIMLQMAMNMMFTPRSDAQYSASDLKRFSMYPLARFCIDNTKDIIGDVPWKIQPKRKPGETNAALNSRSGTDPIVSQLTSYFEFPGCPGPGHSWPEWSRQLCDEMLSIDAGAVLIRRTKNGKVVDTPVVPGAQICRYVDDNGQTPLPPAPAYAQLWEGIPRVNLTMDQLVYKPRNIVWRDSVASQLYGCGPTETAAPEIEIGIDRLAFVDAFYKTGNLSSALQIIPPSADEKQVKIAYQFFDSVMAGNLGKRRGIRAIQGFAREGEKDQVLFPPEPKLADTYDELHIHKICFAYGTSPQRLLKQLNRATAEQNQESADAEGLLPWISWLRLVVNYLIQWVMGFRDYEIVFDTNREQDILKQMQVDIGYVGAAIDPRNESRERRGLDPLPDKNADRAGVMGLNGFMPLGQDWVPPAPPAGGPIERGARVPPQVVQGMLEGKSYKLVLASQANSGKWNRY